MSEDRISILPASILHHILSFVDTREAARTSVLSKQWKYIWRSIPILRFRCEDFSQTDKFTDFVDTTLEFHDDSNIQEFSLKSTVPLNESLVKKWITTVISHSVEHLSLRLTQTDLFLLPSSLYSCESLITLALEIRPVIDFPKYISFPRLKTLKLFGVEFTDECWNEQLFSKCPVLNLLKIVYCTWTDMRSFCISNPALKYLFIVGFEEDVDSLQNCGIKIHAPSLQYLAYEGKIAKDYILSSSLVKAHVDLYLKENGSMWEQGIDYGKAVSKFFRAIAHVTYLTISDRTLQVLSAADNLLNNLPSFTKLCLLNLTQKVTEDAALIALLEKAPNLLALTVEGFVSPWPGEEDNDGNAGDDWCEDNQDTEEVELLRVNIRMTMKTMGGCLIWWLPDVLFYNI